jgi:diaminopimelate epimerase
LLVRVQAAEDDQLLASKHVAERCFENGARVADGVVWFAPRSGFYRMVFFNPDGSHERLCGNGLLIAAAALAPQAPAVVHPIDHPPIDVRVAAGHVQASSCISAERFVRAPTTLGPIVDTGSPHLVLERADSAELDLAAFARALVGELDVNVTVYRLDRGVARARTFERGVDAETLACGTGALAVAFAAHGPVEVRYPGGSYRARAVREGNEVRWTLATAASGVRPG